MISKADRLEMLLTAARDKVSGENSRNPNSSIIMPWEEKVEKSPEFERILKIPRRRWSLEEAQVLADEMTPLLAKDGGTQELRPVQAVSLHDLGALRGLISMARVGAGKTLILLLAPYILESIRPLILVPANLKEKTIRDIKMYSEHWEIPGFIRVESYELLSRKEHADFWEKYRPDFVGCDEAHHLKNTKAAVTKRLKRYLNDIRPQTMLALLSGTFTNRSLKELWHLLRWTLPPESCPLPHSYEQLDMWSRAIDEKVGEANRVEPGVLLDFCNEGERALNRDDPVKAARLGFQRRLVETPGIVATEETFEGASLQIAPVRFTPPPPILKAMKTLREDYETPDEWPISDGVTLARHMKELALGFYYVWDPRPPDEWLEARKEWCRVARRIISTNRRNIDTEAQVKDALADGHYSQYFEVLQEWEELEPTFEPNTKAIWIHDFAIDEAIKWAEKYQGIVWVSHNAFGRRLSEKSGLPYYAGQGLDAQGNFIEDHPPGTPMIVSMHANREGKNLQGWNYNLIVDPMSNGKWWEQLIGRTHREGQLEDTVFVHMFFVVLEHLTSFYKAQGDAHFVEDATGQIQKILYADNLLPTFEELEREDNKVLWEQGELS